MSSAAFTEEKQDDILWNLVKDLEFLKYEHSIEQIKPSRFDFSSNAEFTEVLEFSDFGIDVIKNFLHIGLVSAETSANSSNRNRILLVVWPRFVSPSAYSNRKLYFSELKKVKTQVFHVPDSVFLKYSAGNISLNEIIVATAILAPVEEWKLLERMVISAFYHITFDKPTTEFNGDINVWQNYSKDKLDKAWKQLLFICCGPQGLAYLIKRMIKRNWASIVKEATSSDVTTNGNFDVFCAGDILKLMIEWAKFSFKPDAALNILGELSSVKPVPKLECISEQVKISFAQHLSSSKRFRCSLCPYETNIRCDFQYHERRHSGESPFVCEVCGTAFKRASHLTRHKIMRHTGDYPHQCKYCGRPTMVLAHNKCHMVYHEKSGNLEFKCYKCLLLFKNSAQLIEHMPSHSGDPTFDCSVCLKKCDSEMALLTHLRNHSKEKLFNCHICKKGFMWKSSLQAHYNIHSATRPSFYCQFCNKEFTTNQRRNVHEVGQHTEQFKV